MKIKLAFVLLLSSVLFIACGSKDDNKNSQEQIIVSTTEEIPSIIDTNFILKTNDGKTITIIKEQNIWNISGQDGKVILLDFFATWCPPCKAEIPHLNNIRETYKDQFEIIGLLLEENKSKDEVKAFIDQYKIKYPVANNQDVQKFAKTIDNIKSIPTMFLLNSNGKIVQKYVGMVPEEMLASDIKRALKE